MVGPKKECPTILEYIDEVEYTSEHIQEGKAIYAVYYDGVPIVMKRYSYLRPNPSAKYIQTIFNTSTPALNLAARLNAKYGTNRFMVYEMLKGKRYNTPKPKSYYVPVSQR